MYEIFIKDGNSVTYLEDNLKPLNAQIVKGINTIDTLNLKINLLREGDSPVPSFLNFSHSATVNVYNAKTNEFEFQGRILKVTESMDSNGNMTQEVLCESLLGFLCDSIQAYGDVQNWTVRGLLERLVDCHNECVETFKQMTVGEVTTTDPNDNLYEAIQMESTWDAIQHDLISKIGGELQIRVVDGQIFLDYLEQRGQTKATTIELRKNLQSISRDNDSSVYITRFVPLGKKLLNELGEETEERITIESVNDGRVYLDDTVGIQTYGLRWGFKTWDDVESPQILKTKATNWLAENNRVTQKFSITAVELSLLGLDFDSIDVANSYPVIHDLLGINDTLRVVKKTINLYNPSVSSLEFGEKQKTLSQIQFEKDAQILNDIDNAKKSMEVAYKTAVNAGAEQIRQETRESLTEIRQSTEQMVFDATSSMVSSSDLETLRNQMQTQVGINSEQIFIKFSEAMSSVQNLEGKTNSQFEKMESYIRSGMDDLGRPYVELGSTESLIVLRQENDRIAFLQNGVEVAYFSNNKLSVLDGHFLNSLRIGNFAFIPRENGSLDFKKII